MTVLRTLLEITVYSAALFGAVMLFRVAAKKHASPAMLYAIWFILIARLLMPVTVGGISLIVIPAQQPATEAQQVDLSAQTGGKAETIVFPQAPVADLEETTAFLAPAEAPEVNTESAAADAQHELPWKWNWETALLALWISGGIIVLLNAAVASVRLGRRLSKAPAMPDGWRETAERIKQELGVRGYVRFVMLKDFASPALSASLRPTVVMPFELFWQEDRHTIEFALRHELMHVKRRDHIVCLLWVLLKAAYWFNPVVWLASRQMRLDMETACDSMVVKAMDGGMKKQYASTIIGMYAKPQPRFVLGMALGHTRQAAERRVRGLFMRSRSRRGTVFAAILLAAVMLVACFTTACQPVMGAGAESAATQLPVPSETETEVTAEPSPTPEPSPTQQIDKVGSWQDTFGFGDLTCDVDAQIVWPEACVFPVYKMQKREFNAGFITRLVHYFTKGATGVRETSDTKEELEKQINAIKKLDPYNGKKEELADLNERLKNVTEEVFLPVSDDTLSLPVYNTYAMADGSNVHVRAKDSSVFINKDKYAGVQPESWLVDETSLPKKLRGISFDDIGISEQDATETVNAYIREVGIENLAIAKAERVAYVDGYTSELLSKGWYFTLARNDGSSIPLYFDSELSGMLDFFPSREDYVARWFQEAIYIYVDENGIQEFSWRRPIEVEEVLGADSVIMPFEDMKAHFKKAIEAGYSKAFEREVLGTPEQHIVIEKFVLGNVLVPIKDDPEHHILTPAWLIYYYDTNFDRFGKYVSVFAVNAVDGSVIDISNRVYLDPEEIPAIYDS